MDKTQIERTRRYRQKKKDSGLVAVTALVPTERRQELLEIAATMRAEKEPKE